MSRAGQPAAEPAAAPVIQEPPLPVWTCEFSEIKGPGGAPLNNLTVGAKFGMSCRGDIPVAWLESGALSIVFPKKEDTYTLVALEAGQLKENQVSMTVTAYKAGKHEPEYIRVVQDGHGFEALKPKWEVQSVLDPKEQPKPFESFGPWSLSFPLWLVILLTFLVAAVGAAVVRAVRRYRQRQAMLLELSRHKTALSPVNQFYRDARGLRKRLNQAKSVEELKLLTDELNKEFRLYVLRQYLIPALDWSDRQIVDDLRKRHRKVYSVAGAPLKKTLRELGRIATQKQLLLPDVEQLHRMSLDAVERLESARAEAGKTRRLL